MIRAYLKVITILSISLISCNAEKYKCDINTVKNLKTNSI